jgi:hypothetical protein
MANLAVESQLQQLSGPVSAPPRHNTVDALPHQSLLRASQLHRVGPAGPASLRLAEGSSLAHLRPSVMLSAMSSIHLDTSSVTWRERAVNDESHVRCYNMALDGWKDDKREKGLQYQHIKHGLF